MSITPIQLNIGIKKNIGPDETQVIDIGEFVF